MGTYIWSEQRAKNSPLLSRAMLHVKAKRAVRETQTFFLKFGLNDSSAADIFRFKVKVFRPTTTLPITEVESWVFWCNPMQFNNQCVKNFSRKDLYHEAIRSLRNLMIPYHGNLHMKRAKGEEFPFAFKSYVACQGKKSCAWNPSLWYGTYHESWCILIWPCYNI